MNKQLTAAEQKRADELAEEIAAKKQEVVALKTRIRQCFALSAAYQEERAALFCPYAIGQIFTDDASAVFGLRRCGEFRIEKILPGIAGYEYPTYLVVGRRKNNDGKWGGKTYKFTAEEMEHAVFPQQGD